MALLISAALAGCSSPHVTPHLGPTFPPPSSPAAYRSLPPATHKWSLAKVQCPTLTSTAAQQLGVSGKGTETRSSGHQDLIRIVECRWGPQDRSAVSVTAKLTVTVNQAGSDAGWQLDSRLFEPEPLAGVGEEAFVSQPLDLQGVQIDVRSGNASTRIRLLPATGAADGKAELRRAAAEIAGDVIDELVPA
ncbi:MAG TPA: hypothetical protein VFO77_01455 [Actinoplanes sp.]|nr:hypothetical protein [Actinoplanes sp.]